MPKEDNLKWFNETSIPDNKFDRVRNLNEFSEPVTRRVLRTTPGNYYNRFAIPANLKPDIYYQGKFCKLEFIREMGTTGKQFNRYVYLVYTNETFITAVIVAAEKDSSGNHYLRFDESKEVIGINVQYSNHKKDLGYIVLFKEEDQVFWCWQWHDNYDVSITITRHRD